MSQVSFAFVLGTTLLMSYRNFRCELACQYIQDIAILDMSPKQNYHRVLSLANKTVCCPPLAIAITTAHCVTIFHQGMTFCSSLLPLDLWGFF